MIDIYAALRKIDALMPLDVALANDGETWLVSSYALPQHPICSCGPNKEYAEVICTALYEAQGAIQARKDFFSRFLPPQPPHHSHKFRSDEFVQSFAA